MMKKFFGFILAMILTLTCVVGFAACGTGDLEKQISDLTDKVNSSTNTELKKLIDDNKKEAETTITALTARITELERSLSAAETKISTLTGLINTLTGTVDTLSATIAELKTIIENDAIGNAALKAKLDELQAQYNSANTSIGSLAEEINKLKTDITELRSTSDIMETRIELLEGAMNIEPTVLQMGDTFTFKSPSGLPMFKVRLVEYRSGGIMDINIKRLNIPNYVPINSYFTTCLYNENSNPKFYYKISNISADDELCGDDFSKIYSFGFSGSTIELKDVTYFIIGLPSNNDLDIPAEKKYIIPYAIYIP